MAEKKINKQSFLAWLKSKVIYGQVVPISFVSRYSSVLILLLLLAIGYISNKFMCQLDMAEIRSLKQELARVKTDYVNASAAYYSRIRETEMIHLADSMGLGLKSPDCPPYKLTSK